MARQAGGAKRGGHGAEFVLWSDLLGEARCEVRGAKCEVRDAKPAPSEIVRVVEGGHEYQL